MHIIDFNASGGNQNPNIEKEYTPQTSELLVLPVEVCASSTCISSQNTYKLVKILFMIHLFSNSKYLSCTCKYLNSVFKQTTPVHRAKYIIAQHEITFRSQVKHRRLAYYMYCALASTRNNIITFALRFRMCNEATLKAMVNMEDCPAAFKNSYVRLPRWLFRNLENNASTKDSHPLPLLRFLFNQNKVHQYISPGNSADDVFRWFQSERSNLPRAIPIPDLDSYNGYALVRAVRANHIPLIRFLLDHGATATHTALRAAIRKRDLNLVKMLIEKDAEDQNANENGKRPRTEDRIVVTQWILEMAVDEGLNAREIVKYFIEEKGMRPGDWVKEKIDRKGFFKDKPITRRGVASRK